MDHLAREVGLDPAEIWSRNYLPKGESVVNTAGIPYDWVDYEPPLDRVLELAGYGELRAKQSEQRDRGGRLLGVGICSYVDATGLGSSPLLSLTNYQWSDTSPWTTAETCSTRYWWRARCGAGSRRGWGRPCLRR